MSVRDEKVALKAEVDRLRAWYSCLSPDRNDDETLTCVLCGEDKCERGFATQAGGTKSFHGIHLECWKREKYR